MLKSSLRIAQGKNVLCRNLVTSPNPHAWIFSKVGVIRSLLIVIFIHFCSLKQLFEKLSRRLQNPQAIRVF
jgi:hypothetical protein